MIVFRDGDLYVPEADLWLDPRRRRPVAVVSHAHADHAGRHGRILATRETLRLLERRLGWCAGEPLAFDETREVGAARITLLRAGHILGSAQILVETKGLRSVYTGDLKVRGGLTSGRCDVPACDELFLDATFGHPRYRFMTDDLLRRIVEQALERARRRRRVPVFLGYALGKAQEAAAMVESLGRLPVLAGEAHDLAEVYRACGAPPVRFESLDHRVPEDGVVFVAPHRAQRERIAHLGSVHTVFLSGWALGGGRPLPPGTDECLPFSDHSDFEELVSFSLATGARRVVPLFGPPNAAANLAGRGVPAVLAPSEGSWAAGAPG